MGNGLEDGVEIGPLINRQALDQALEHIADAVSRGARVACGGRRWEGGPEGWFLEPTILVDVPREARCLARGDVRPRRSAVRVRRRGGGRPAKPTTPPMAWPPTPSPAMSPACGGWPNRLEAGTIGINDAVPTTSQCPFGGVKESGWGRELGSEGLDAFLETKRVSIGVQE